MFLDAVIVFVGVAGNHHAAVERQLGPVLDHAGINEMVVTSPDLAAIVRHSDASKEVVKHLHVDGVIGAALITANGQESFRLVIYDGNGNMRSLGETPLDHHRLTADDIQVLGINLTEEMSSLKPTVPRGSVIVAPRPTPTPPPTLIAPVSVRAASSVEVRTPVPVPPIEKAEAAPKQVAEANAVSLDEIEAMTGTGPDDTGGSSVTDAAPDANDGSSATLHLHVGAGLGMTGRSFSAPAGVTGYTSTPVSTVRFAAGVQPTERTSIEVAAERTISMSTDLDSVMASTMISRWQIDGGLKLVDRSVQVTANLGLGHRAFTIDATETNGRTPDSEYNYVAIGARVAMPIGTRVVVRGGAELEPVFGGADAMQMALGSSTRWGLDVAASMDYVLLHHLVATAAFDYQRFSWSWSAAGARASTGASDSYPTGTLALRSEF